MLPWLVAGALAPWVLLWKGHSGEVQSVSFLLQRPGMFETAELGRKVGRKEFASRVARLRSRLLLAQQAVRRANIPLVIIVAGHDGAGKGEVVHRLNEWLDPRGIDAFTFWKMQKEECDYPPYWRFWRALPARGRMTVYFWGWYNDPMLLHASKAIASAKLDQQLHRIAVLERMLAEDGALILKFWFHLSSSAYRQRLKAQQKRPQPVETVGSVRGVQPSYRRLLRTADRAIRLTDASYAPWHVIEADDANYRDLRTASLLLKTLERRLAPRSDRVPSRAPALLPAQAKEPHPATILDHVDLSRTLTRKQYTRQLAKLQAGLHRLGWTAHQEKISLVIVFEGWDAAGKGGAIRRVTEAIDARLFHVIPVAAPTEEERAHHYLWRFWRHLPRAGMVAVFDRSWYGRVLVERVEGLATPEEWSRAYAEINEFEQQLVEHGILLCKFWIHISKEEQLRRFRKRQTTPYKQYKITPDDWRNRGKWGAYATAVNEMVARTSTGFAPWVLIPGDQKRVARIQILKTIYRRLKQAV